MNFLGLKHNGISLKTCATRSQFQTILDTRREVVRYTLTI